MFVDQFRRHSLGLWFSKLLKISSIREGKRKGIYMRQSLISPPLLQSLPEIRGKQDSSISEPPVSEETCRKIGKVTKENVHSEICIKHLWKDSCCAGHGWTMVRKVMVLTFSRGEDTIAILCGFTVELHHPCPPPTTRCQ